MIVRKLRLERGWSQEDLAQISGLSVRTIQRIERGKRPGLESLKCLAAVFETTLAELAPEGPSVDAGTLEDPAAIREEGEAIEYVDNLKGFHINWISFLIVIPCLYLLQVFVTPDESWILYPIFGWLLGIALHGAVIVVMFGGFGLFGADWERRQIEKRREQQERRDSTPQS